MNAAELNEVHGSGGCAASLRSRSQRFLSRHRDARRRYRCGIKSRHPSRARMAANFRITGRYTRKAELHGRDPDFSRLQVRTAEANP